MKKRTGWQSFFKAVRVSLTGLTLTVIFLIVNPLVPEGISLTREKRQGQVLNGFIDHYNPAVPKAEREILIETLLQESRRLKIPDAMRIDDQPIDRLHFVVAFVKVESTFKREAVSSADARGYMQLMPDTARWLDEQNGTSSSEPIERLHETRTNIAAGVDYLNELMEILPEARQVALAYNAGPGNLENGIYVEDYWIKIRGAYRELRERAGN